MNLVKEHWVKEDIEQFQNYLKSFSKGKEKSEWEQRIVNTALPCLAISSDKVKEIVKEIKKGNFLEFIDLWIWQYHTNTTIIGELICQIEDFETMKRYLREYSQMADNWGTIDCLKFKISKSNKDKYLSLAKELIKSNHTFTRRLALIILLKLTNEKEYIDEILQIANSIPGEQEYYVNMANAWLIAECFIKDRNKALALFEQNNLNKFTINKAISKCRDSFRVSKNDKELLIKYRKN